MESSWRPLALKSFLGVKEAFKDSGAVAAVVADVDVDVMVADKVVVDIIGVVVAINGRLNSAEVYPSNGLFRKMWSKVLSSAATEAVSERAAPNGPAPAASLAKEFLAEAETGKAQERNIAAMVKLETRSTTKAVYTASSTPKGDVIHRSYTAR